MGILAEAAKKEGQKAKSDKEHLKPDPKHKKKHAKPSPEMASNAPGADPGATEPDSAGPDAEPEGNAEASDEADTGDQESPQPQGEDGSPDQEVQGSASPAQPQDPQDQGGGDAGAQPDQGNAPSDDAGQGQGQDAGAQGAAPDAGAEDDSQDSAPGGQPSQAAGGAQDHVDLSKIPISPALKEEFMRCNAALHTALYTNDKVAQSVIDGVVPSGPHKVESVARMATLLVVQINKQLNFIHDTPQVVMPFTQDCVEHVLDLVTQVKKIQFSQQEAHAALGTAQEIIMHTVGVTKKQMQAVRHTLPRSQIMDGADKYRQHLQFIKGVQGPNSPDQGAAASQSGQPQPQSGPPPGQPPESGQPQPQPGAPVTAAPGPGQSAPPGGMLSQAAAPQGAQ
jgi:hypothetical protein